MAGRVQSRLLVVGVVIFVGLVVGGVLLVRQEPDGGSDASCGPATQKEAEAALEKIFELYADPSADPAEPPAFQGAGIGEREGSPVVTGMLLPGTDVDSYVTCIDDVPVEWIFAGPFKGD
jgi:hypothetical protein